MKIYGLELYEDVFDEDFLEIGPEVVRNVSDLIRILEKMKEEEFSLHVYDGHNDFAEWIMEAYWDEKLAGKILKARDRKEIIGILKGALKVSSKKRLIGGKTRKGRVLKEIGEMH